MALSRAEIKNLVRRIEQLLNTDIPGTPRIGGRVMYVALPGSGSKSKNALSPRAKQVLAYLNRNRRGTAKALQAALRVNRNVIAGAMHELKQAGFVRSEAFAGVPGDVGRARIETAAGYAPRAKRRAKR